MQRGITVPCKALHPILEELSKEYSGKIDIYQIDVDQEQDLAAAFGIAGRLPSNFQSFGLAS